MAATEKIKEISERARKAAMADKERLEAAARKAEALAKERGAEVRGKLAEHAPHGKGQHPAE